MFGAFSTLSELKPVLVELKPFEPLIYAANDGKARAHFENLLVSDFLEKPVHPVKFTRVTLC